MSILILMYELCNTWKVMKRAKINKKNGKKQKVMNIMENNEKNGNKCEVMNRMERNGK